MQWRNGSHFGQRLERRGFVKLGGGCFSNVYAKPGSDRVIKVSYNKAPDGWPEYVIWAAENGWAGTLAPIVYSFRKFTGSEGAFYVAVIERLTCTLRAANDEKLEERRYNLAYNLDSWSGGTRINDPFEAQFCAEFIAFKRTMQCTLDGHDDNWMIKGERLVLTDPLSWKNGESTAPARFRSRAPSNHAR